MAKTNDQKDTSVKIGMDGGAVGEGVNSDNSFSDAGLENARLLRKAAKKDK